MSKGENVKADLSYSNLANQDMSGRMLVESKFNYSDCTGLNLANANLYGADFTGARLVDAIISLSCFTFKKVKFDSRQVEYFLYLLTLADISDDTKNSLIALIGKERIATLNRVFGQQ